MPMICFDSTLVCSIPYLTRTTNYWEILKLLPVICISIISEIDRVCNDVQVGATCTSIQDPQCS